MNQPFELVNLDASIKAPITMTTTHHDSSDDGLDPSEFISQKDAPLSKIKRNSKSPDETRTLLGSEGMGYNSSYLAETLSASKLMDSFISLGGLQFQSKDSYETRNESPQVCLQGRNKAIRKELRKGIAHHKDVLIQGINCTELRQQLGRILKLLFENNLQLHQVYSSELDFTKVFMKNLTKWDQKRTAVLDKIKLIKSEDNTYGTKLKSLLNEDLKVDSELEGLYQRIEELKNKKQTLQSEIGQTISVLESRSSKYVSLFRTLEKQGKDAIFNYLAQDISRTENIDALITTIPVDSSFEKKVKLTHNPTSATDVDKNVIGIAKQNDPVIGMVPYNYNTSVDAIKDDKDLKTSPYEKGFSNGAQQIARVKETISAFVENAFSKEKPPEVQKKALDDEQNLITEMVDLEPIIQLLSSKIEAIEEFLINTAKLAESYHKDAILWNNVCEFVESQEEKAFTEINISKNPESITTILQESFEFLKDKLHSRSQEKAVTEKQEKYILALLRSECLNVAFALEKLIPGSDYVSQIEDLGKLSLEPVSIDNKYLLHSRIAATGNDQEEISLSPEIDKKTSVFSLSFSKGLKRE